MFVANTQPEIQTIESRRIYRVFMVLMRFYVTAQGQCTLVGVTTHTRNELCSHLHTNRGKPQGC